MTAFCIISSSSWLTTTKLARAMYFIRFVVLQQAGVLVIFSCRFCACGNVRRVSEQGMYGYAFRDERMMCRKRHTSSSSLWCMKWIFDSLPILAATTTTTTARSSSRFVLVFFKHSKKGFLNRLAKASSTNTRVPFIALVVSYRTHTIYSGSFAGTHGRCIHESVRGGLPRQGVAQVFTQRYRVVRLRVQQQRTKLLWGLIQQSVGKGFEKCIGRMFRHNDKFVHRQSFSRGRTQNFGDTRIDKNLVIRPNSGMIGTSTKSHRQGSLFASTKGGFDFLLIRS
mmetsp:Transcript_960/g.2020  ORF Transcript_960/g.2020 Transcript_960/m.2020 type:complete len:282 (+) Transcript_960:26-871(+)